MLLGPGAGCGPFTCPLRRRACCAGEEPLPPELQGQLDWEVLTAPYFIEAAVVLPQHGALLLADTGGCASLGCCSQSPGRFGALPAAHWEPLTAGATFQSLTACSAGTAGRCSCGRRAGRRLRCGRPALHAARVPRLCGPSCMLSRPRYATATTTLPRLQARVGASSPCLPCRLLHGRRGVRPPEPGQHRRSKEGGRKQAPMQGRGWGQQVARLRVFRCPSLFSCQGQFAARSHGPWLPPSQW